MPQHTGRPETAEGVGRRVDGAPPSVLRVRFAPATLSLFPHVSGDYRVVALSPSYEWADISQPVDTLESVVECSGVKPFNRPDAVGGWGHILPGC